MPGDFPLLNKLGKLEDGIMIIPPVPVLTESMEGYRAMDLISKYMLQTIPHYIRHLGILRIYKPGWRMLDVACGNCELAEILYHNRMSLNYYGIDVRKDALKKALTRLGQANINLICKDLRKALPFNDEVFDLVVSEETVEHMAKAQAKRLLRECYRVLRPGGTMLVTTPVREGKAKHWDPATGEGEWGHIYEWGYGELQRELTSIGLIVKRVYGLSSRLNIHHLDKVFKGDAFYEGIRSYLPPIFVKTLATFSRPELGFLQITICQKPRKVERRKVMGA